MGGSTQARGEKLARYQLSIGVSEPLRSNSATTSSISGWSPHARRFAQSLTESHSSATPSWRKSSMYHERIICSMPAV